MKKLIAVIISLFVCSFYSAAETFNISNYEVSITINPNGSFDVSELIYVHFNEASHGIIRDIPCHYKQSETATFEKAGQEGYSENYDIIIRNISVDGNEFAVSEDKGISSIRIGSENKKVSGDVKYALHYTVWGAINSFSDHHEFYWNIIGTDWGCTIDKASFTIVFAKPLKLTNDDVICFTGKAGTTSRLTSIAIDGKSVQGTCNKPLQAFHGLTAAVKLPLNYFTSTEIPLEAYAQHFIIRKLSSVLKVQPDASLDVEERFEVEFFRPCKDFTRKFNRPDEFETTPQNYQDIMLTNINASAVASQEIKTTFSSTGFGRNKYITIKNNSGEFTGKVIFTNTYKAWGAFRFINGIAQFQWDVLPGTMNEPCAEFDFELLTGTSLKVQTEFLNFYRNGTTPVFIAAEKDKKTFSFSGKYASPVTDNSSITLKAAFKESSFTEASIPYDIYARNYVIRDFSTDLTIEPDGVIRMQHYYNVKFTDPENPGNVFSTQVRATFQSDFRNYTGINFTLPRWSLMGNVYKTLLTDEHTKGSNCSMLPDWNGFSKSIIWKPASSPRPDSVFSNEYRIFSLLQSNGENYFLNFPISGLFDEPAAAGRFSIHLPDMKGLKPTSCEACIQGPDLICENIPLTIKDNEINGKLVHGLKAGQTIVLKLAFPKACITDSNYLLYLRLFVKNNIFLLIPLFFFLVLFIIWYYVGRDKKDHLVVRYRPPADITPAEAGFLWDNHLHRRDLVALIYYWAGNGYLTIKEKADVSGSGKDYELTKVRDLPATAKDYEKTIFSALFVKHTTVSVSSLKNNFYCHMISAHKQLEEYGRYKNFYVPGTRGFSVALRILAWAVFITGMIVMMNTWYNFAQVLVCFLSLFVMLLVFGNIMPKRGHFGAAKHAQLKGFREFIAKAESAKLKELLDENPAYFDETVSYAIVLGLGDQWAEKFKPLIAAPPAWYGSHDGAFDTSIFVRGIIHGMHMMDHNLNYHYAQSSRYGYSGSSVFSSHSTFGGGGSAFRGGGFTGGGYGGGGGRSW